jgi:hypothetical protein
MTYRIGEVDILSEPEDEEYAQLADAEGAAIALSYGDTPIAIWDDRGECIGIVFQQKTFWPEPHHSTVRGA